MTSTKKAAPKRDPESDFYDTVKRARVMVRCASGKITVGILEWVATYSIGVRDEVDGRVVLIMKGSMESIEGTEVRREPA